MLGPGLGLIEPIPNLQRARGAVYVLSQEGRAFVDGLDMALMRIALAREK